MANEWLRLWHDMPTDPKWRTIARISKQPIHLVISVYIHMLVDASRNVTRGHVDVTHEDLASALDVTEDQISDILHAMDGRVIEENGFLSGWDRRQVKREDAGSENGAKSAAARKAEQREREKQIAETDKSRQCHDESRNVTLDTDKIREEGKPSATASPPADLPPDVSKSTPDKPASSVTFRTFMSACSASGAEAVPPDDPVFEWAETAGVPLDFLRLAWVEFRSRYLSSSKRYKDWRRVFRNAVRDNWFKLWFCNDQGVVCLSNQGRLIQKTHVDAAA